ncbi:hypothetical protein AMS59_00625 [Lysinibacillus sp. FJAT-14745]|uniref:alpha/beta fold hydrolase n=1 Tax=Lysinibacillus sp. FJAT-14745 TaxID=1704289 RepID=UPI0006AB9AA4|nr:alpha/beta fold hydrolase [Lysinibacillus sp. FJAT-14745]KOP80986.1 hypothetical protein AMS59_00625 [Lysinibacillus sp. FJAT-14745]
MKQNIYQWGDSQNPTLLFLHGLGSTGLAYGELAKYLPEYHIVSFDLPGHGYAKALEEEEAYLPSNLIEEIEATINQQLGNTSHYLTSFNRSPYPICVEMNAVLSHFSAGVQLSAERS